MAKYLEWQQRLTIGKGKHLTVEEHTVKDMHPLHWHSFFELEIVLSGKGRCIINDVEYCVPNKNLFLLNFTDFHCVYADEPMCILNLSFDEEMIGEKEAAMLLFSEMQRAYSLSGDEYDRILSAAKLLMHECSIDGECQRKLLSYILTSVFRNSRNIPKNDNLSEHISRIKKSIIYMQMHFKEDISLDLIAKEAGYNPTYFSELFKKATGESYLRKLTKLRIGYARTLLANGFTASEASLYSGFGSLSAFHRAFILECGMTPGEYRCTCSAACAGKK